MGTPREYEVQMLYNMENMTAASTTYWRSFYKMYDSNLGLGISHTLIIHQRLTINYVANPTPARPLFIKIVVLNMETVAQHQ